MGEEMDDVFLLSRIQFALTIMFHYIFRPLSIGLGAIMVIMEGMYLRTGNVIYHQMTKFGSSGKCALCAGTFPRILRPEHHHLRPRGFVSGRP
jgi:hypothetical protein